jgi:hypothetical protein
MLQIIFENKKEPTFFVFLKSRREDYEVSPPFRTQMGDGYDFFASVRDGVSIHHLGKGLWCSKKPKTEDNENEDTHHQRAHVKNI